MVVVFGRIGEPGLSELQNLLAMIGLDAIAFGTEHARLAIDAYRRFGKGRHRAALNVGDCFSYALAKATGEPLLFKGNDFAQSDIERAA